MNLKDLENLNLNYLLESGHDEGWEDVQNNPDLLRRKPTFQPWHPWMNPDIPPVLIPTGNPLFPLVPSWIPGQDHIDNQEDEFGGDDNWRPGESDDRWYGPMA